MQVSTRVTQGSNHTGQCYFKLDCAQRAQTSAKAQISSKNDQGFEYDFRIYLDPYVCRIAHKMYWIHSLVATSHFAKDRKNQLVTVQEMLITLLRSAISKK